MFISLGFIKNRGKNVKKNINSVGKYDIIVHWMWRKNGAKKVKEELIIVQDGESKSLDIHQGNDGFH